MSLTNGDLQAISQLLDAKFKCELHPVKEELKVLKSDVSELKSDVSELKSDVLILKSDVLELKSNISGLNGEVSNLKSQVSNLESDMTSVKMDIENNIKPQIQMLYDIYVPAVKKFEKSALQIESMKLDIEVLKDIVTKHSKQLEKIS